MKLTMGKGGTALYPSTARDRLRCVLEGHDYYPVLNEPVEWCPRCGKSRSPRESAEPAATAIAKLALHLGEIGLKLAGKALVALAAVLQRRRQASLEKPPSARSEGVDAAEVAVATDNPPTPRLDLTALENILHIEEAGTSGLIVDTADGRRLRVSANKEPGSGLFFASYETLGAFNRREREILAWQPTSSYGAAVANTVEECLEATLAEIEAGPRRRRQKSRSSMRARKPPPSRGG